MDELERYRATGFLPEQILMMYEHLTVTADLLSRLICNDIPIMIQAVDDAESWLQGYLSYCKKDYH